MIVATGMLAGMGLVAGLGLGLAARAFAVDVDPRREQVNDLLPGANCGGCGFAGCNDFAGAVVEGKTGADGCPAGGSETALAIAAVMGASIDEKEREVALILCQGTDDLAPRKYRYNGSASCASATLLAGGDKLCSYGCLGLGDCVRACNFSAIEIIYGGIARVMSERCVGCGICVTSCPKNLIKLVPESSTIHVLCRNMDKGAAVRKACERGCIGCRKCAKALPDGEISIGDFLASVDYSRPPCDEGLIAECPTGSLVGRHLVSSSTDRNCA